MMENNKSKSLERSKKTSFTIAKVLAKEGCSVIPGGGVAFEAVRALVNHAKQFQNDRTESRLLDFHQHLLGGEINDTEQKEFIEKPISLEDYYSLLSYATQDDEEKKVQLYANLLRSFSNGLIPNENKLHILKVAKAITFEEAEFIRRFFILEKYDIMPEKGSSVNASEMIKSNNLKVRIMIQNLIRFGFLLETSSEKCEPTQLLNIAVEGLYLKDDLKPSSIGKVTWSGINIMIVSYQLDVHSIITFKLEEILRKCRIKSTIALLNDRNVKNANIFYHGFIFLLDSKEIPNDNRKAIEKLITKKVIIKLLLKGDDGTVPKDTLPELAADEVLPVDINLKEDENLFEEVIQRYLK